MRAVDDNGVYVFAQNGKPRVKRIQKKMDGSLLIKSDNKEYETETVPVGEVQDFRVIGRVVWPRL